MKLRIFVSSTCYDLSIIRSQLKSFIENMGYDAVLSEFNDIFYDPKDHTHESCVKEIANADLVILIIGSRYGGQGTQNLKNMIDFNKLSNMARNVDIIDKEQLSVTQYEIFKAIESEIPVYCFVDDAVWHDHKVYERNKEKENVIKVMTFPSIEKNESAPYIFEFINFMRTRIHNNAIFPFTKLEDIEACLLKQWSNLFQTLLSESKKSRDSNNQMGQITERLEDMKALIMSSVNKDDNKSKDVAKGVLKYRTMINYVSEFIPSPDMVLKRINWEELLKQSHIKETRNYLDEKMQNRIAIIKDDNTFYLHRFIFDDMNFSSCKDIWNEFSNIDQEVKKIIVDAVRDSSNTFAKDLKYYNRDFDEYLSEILFSNVNNVKKDDNDMPF